MLGFFARMCKEKGLDTLVEAFILLKQGGKLPALKFHIGGGCGPGDEPFVSQLKQRLQSADVLGDVEFHPNLTREQKLAFLRSLTVFSVPANYGEAFGLYVIEALASGVPVVQPRTASFPELIAASGGGVLCEPGSAPALASAIEQLLLNPEKLQALAESGRKTVPEKFSIERMSGELVQTFQQLQPAHD